MMSETTTTGIDPDGRPSSLVWPGGTAPTPAGDGGESDEAERRPLSLTGDDIPPVPDEIVRAALAAPDHWLGMVDPAWKGDGPPPSWAIVGQWRSGLQGEIVEWQDNGDYQPSPRALGWPDATDAVDEAVQLAATGYGPGDDVTKTLAVADVAVLMTADDEPTRTASGDGTAVVPVYTSPTHLHAAGRFKFEVMGASAALALLPDGHLLYLNSSAAVSMTVDSDALREAIEAAQDEAAYGEATDGEATYDDDEATDVATDGAVTTVGPAQRSAGVTIDDLELPDLELPALDLDDYEDAEDAGDAEAGSGEDREAADAVGAESAEAAETAAPRTDTVSSSDDVLAQLAKRRQPKTEAAEDETAGGSDSTI